MSPRDVEIRIDHLALNGFRTGDGPEIGRAVQAELARLLSTAGLPSSWRSEQQVGSVRVPAIRAHRGAQPAEIGRHVGQAIYGGLSHER
jgi:hypothetical protein